MMHNNPESMGLLSILVATGAALGLGKLLVSDEVLTPRVVIGRTLLGCGTSTVAGVGLIWIPDLHPLALVAVGSALGIVGASALEVWLKKHLAAHSPAQKRRATDK